MKLTLKDVIFAAIVAAVMNVISFVTVVAVLGVPIPGIRTIVVAPFYGLLAVVSIKRINKPISLSLISFLCGAPLGFISPAIFLFTFGSGILADIIRSIFLKDTSKVYNLVITAAVYMGAMMIIATIVDILMLRETTLGQVFANPIMQIFGLVSTCALGGIGGFLGSKITKEFKSASIIKWKIGECYEIFK